MSPTIVGVDIGSRSVRAVELKNPASSKPTITRFHEVPLPETAVRRGEVIEVGTVSTALKTLWSTGGFTARNVVLGMGGQPVFVRDLTVPKAPLAQIREALPFHVQELLPVPVTDTLLDFYPVAEGRGEHGPVVSGLLVAAIKESVSNNVAAALHAGLRPVHVDLVPFALVRALTPIRTFKGRSAVVTIGATTMNLIVVHDGVPQFVRIIPGGGNDLDKALSTRMGVPPVEAEQLKLRIGMNAARATPDERPIVETIYHSVGELLTGIRNTLNYYYTSAKPAAPLDRVILSGGGARLDGFEAALADAIGLQVQRVDAFGAAVVPAALRKRISPAHADPMATAFGLALGSKP